MTYLPPITDPLALRQHFVALDTQQLVHVAKAIHRHAEQHPEMTDRAALQTVKLLIEEALEHEPG